jgi:hypothetical protein
MTPPDLAVADRAMMLAYTSTHTHMQRQTKALMHMHKQIHRHTQANRFTSINKYKDTQTHANRRTHTHTQTHTHRGSPRRR